MKLDKDKYNELQEVIGYNFKNLSLLEEALTHPSFSKERKITLNYQRLEFLGDKILSAVIAESLFKQFTRENEGSLSKRHSLAICGDSCSKIGVGIGIEKAIKLGKGEEIIGGRGNKRNIENAVEALIGAIYLDCQNYEQTKNITNSLWQKLEIGKDKLPPKDPISELQEFVQLKTKKLPQYSLEKDGGSDHKPNFIATVIIPTAKYKNPNPTTFSAHGPSKKEAQKNVAILALKNLINPKSHS